MNSNYAFKISICGIASKIFKYGMQEMTFVLDTLPPLTAVSKTWNLVTLREKIKMNSQMLCSSKECSNNLDFFQEQPYGASQNQS